MKTRTPVRLWLSNWFHTAYYLLQLIRNNPDRQVFETFGSSYDPYSAVLRACDHAFIEPPLTGEEYADYCLAFCKKHRIDVFLPDYKRFLAIVPYLESFWKIGAKPLICPNSALLHLLHDKALTYQSCKTNKLCAIPEYAVVNTAEQFKQAYTQLQTQGYRVCFRPRRGQGGAGFRIISSLTTQLSSLYQYLAPTVSFSEIYPLLATEKQFEDLILSEYLEGPEYSIDCLADKGKLCAAVPRKKLNSRARYLENNPLLLEIAHKITEFYQLSYLFNIQVRYQGDTPKLLEINPRMSGGLHIACLSGINFPYWAIKLLLKGELDNLPPPRLDLLTTQVEEAMMLI